MMNCQMPQGHPTHCGCVLPTTEYVGYDLHPLLKSERRQLQDKIREAEQRFDLAYSQACSKFTRIINESDLTVQEKQDILDQLWK